MMRRSAHYARASYRAKSAEALAAELAELKKASAAAERKLTDACAELEKSIRDLIPPALNAHFAMLTRMQPRDAFELAARERFVQDPPFSTILTGIADFTGVKTRTLAGKLPFFELGEKKAKSDGEASVYPTPHVDCFPMSVTSSTSHPSLHGGVAIASSSWMAGTRERRRAPRRGISSR